MQEVSSNNNPDADKPHRVFFRGFGSGKITSRVFSNRSLVDTFVSGNEIRELVLIQLASDKVPDFKQSTVNFNKQKSCRVPCETCNGKNKRLTSEPCCIECSGARYRTEMSEQFVRRRI